MSNTQRTLTFFASLHLTIFKQPYQNLLFQQATKIECIPSWKREGIFFNAANLDKCEPAAHKKPCNNGMYISCFAPTTACTAVLPPMCNAVCKNTMARKRAAPDTPKPVAPYSLPHVPLPPRAVRPQSWKPASKNCPNCIKFLLCKALISHSFGMALKRTSPLKDYS